MCRMAKSAPGLSSVRLGEYGGRGIQTRASSKPFPQEFELFSFTKTTWTAKGWLTLLLEYPPRVNQTSQNSFEVWFAKTTDVRENAGGGGGGGGAGSAVAITNGPHGEIQVPTVLKISPGKTLFTPFALRF